MEQLLSPPPSPLLPSSPSLAFSQPHPRIVPPSLVSVLKANIAYPDKQPEEVRWSRELEELFYLLTWEQWYDLLDQHQADLTILQAGTATEDEEATAFRRYDVRMNQVLAVYYARQSYVVEEEAQGISHARQQARLNRFEWGHMTSIAERDAMEEMCLNPPPRCCTPPPGVHVSPATPLSIRTNKVHHVHPDVEYLLPAPLEYLLPDHSLVPIPDLGGLTLENPREDDEGWGVVDDWADESF
ncbi:hypothetical protein RQP46_008487 [Phenoliferia psychrophenolica]